MTVSGPSTSWILLVVLAIFSLPATQPAIDHDCLFTYCSKRRLFMSLTPFLAIRLDFFLRRETRLVNCLWCVDKFVKILQVFVWRVALLSQPLWFFVLVPLYRILLPFLKTVFGDMFACSIEAVDTTQLWSNHFQKYVMFHMTNWGIVGHDWFWLTFHCSLVSIRLPF